MLQIPKERFIPADLRNLPPAAEFGQFDLAICLEIAEHLPESCADALIKFLSELAPAVLFGAAIPGQGGVNHINEQWQSYWVAKFSRHQLYAPKDNKRMVFFSLPAPIRSKSRSSIFSGWPLAKV
jgi:hypothetical protein